MKNLKDLPSRIFLGKKKGIGVLIFGLIFVIGFISYTIYNVNRKQKIYDSIKVVLGSSKTVEYGTEDYDPRSLIKKSTGNVKLVSSKVDTSKLGESEVVFEVKKADVTKKIAVKVNVDDTNPPVITLKEKEIKIYVGTKHNLMDNIESVTDLIDGEIPYVAQEDVLEDQKNYYTILSQFNSDNIGDYPITVKSSDKNGYTSEEQFVVKVVERPVVYKKVSYSKKAPSINTSSLVSVAYSLLGSAYVPGGSSTTGFDCSGFVSFVYRQMGKAIPRSTGGQLTVGVRIAREDMLPGDILVWSSYGGSPTHTGIYVGGGNMIHAANPRKGVIVSNIYSWPETLIAIRRV